jgi:hypothetical protein
MSEASDREPSDHPATEDRDSDQPHTGARTAAAGTPVPVDIARDREARTVWVVLLAGPVLWFAHFMLVYLVAEAGCTGEGTGLRLFDPPVPAVTTVVATVVAAVACLGTMAWGLRWWRRDRDRRGDPGYTAQEFSAFASLAFVGALLSGLSFLAVLFVGVSGVVFTGC